METAMQSTDLDRDIELTVTECIRSVCGEEGIAGSITLDRKLSDLAIDSMRLVEIVYEIEKSFGIEIREEFLVTIESVGDFTEVVRTAISTSKTV